MAKPKAPVWLREAFRDGVDERAFWNQEITVAGAPARGRGSAGCWLAQHDPRHRPCSGPLERFHFIPRQRVENAMYDALYEAIDADTDRWLSVNERWDLILLAAWDPRNGGIGCEHHHRRFDGHRHSPENPKIVIPGIDAPTHVLDFTTDYGLESAFVERFAGAEVMRSGTLVL